MFNNKIRFISQDYDYSYDYSDFTIKPSTQKPSTTSTQSSPSSSFPTSIPTSSKPNPTEQPILTGSNILLSTQTTSKPLLGSTKPPQNELSTTEDPSKNKENSTMINNDKNTTAEATSTTTAKTEKLEEIISPGKIKVQILETPVSMSLVPGEELTQPQSNVVNSMTQTSEVLHVRKCASGFTRDQKGRCRRVRKPSGSSSL